MPINPYEKYKQQSVMTMTQGEMLTMLYDEIIKQLSGAVIYIGEKDYSKTNAALKKAQKILGHLDSTLDFKYDISNNLSALYRYFIRQIVEANVKKITRPIDDVLPMVEDLRDTFIQADRLARAQ